MGQRDWAVFTCHPGFGMVNGHTMKTAVVNVTKILDQSRRARMFAQELQAVAQDWQKKIQVSEHLRQQVDEKLSKINEGTSVDTMFGLERERRLLDMEINHMRERSELDLNLRAQRFQAQVAEEIAPLIAEHAKKQSIEVVLNAMGPQLLYHGPALDMTQEILKLYDQRKG